MIIVVVVVIVVILVNHQIRGQVWGPIAPPSQTGASELDFKLELEYAHPRGTYSWPSLGGTTCLTLLV